MLRKGNQLCWNQRQDNDIFRELFSSLGAEMHLNDDQLYGLKKIICAIFGEKRLNSVNDARRKIFWEKMEKNKKIADLSLLPPSQSSLAKHSRRSNYIAFMWKNSHGPMRDFESPTYHG
eukprot:Seg1345.17 transcript_id=Seg1345.17/GoldUCD/mRNA.D3Y31 product="hypothetical protein" protein_id=Seg1345.17/GoldUCD/D3Y31